MVLWRKRQENFKEGNAIKHISLKTLKRVLWLLFLYKIVVFPSCFDIRRNLIYMLYLEWYDAKYIEKSRSFQNQSVFPLFSEKKKKHLQKICKCLIIKVDQPGLEPGTSRLWVCCSNQLSYKSGFGTLAIPNAAVTIRGCKINHFRGILQINWRENSVQWIFSVDWICCFISYSPDFANE